MDVHTWHPFCPADTVLSPKSNFLFLSDFSGWLTSVGFKGSRSSGIEKTANACTNAWDHLPGSTATFLLRTQYPLTNQY